MELRNSFAYSRAEPSRLAGQPKRRFTLMVPIRFKTVSRDRDGALESERAKVKRNPCQAVSGWPPPPPRSEKTIGCQPNALDERRHLARRTVSTAATFGQIQRESNHSECTSTVMAAAVNCWPAKHKSAGRLLRRLWTTIQPSHKRLSTSALGSHV